MTTQTLPIKIILCGDDWTEPARVDIGSAGTLDEAKALVAEAGYVVMDQDDDKYEPYGACETSDTWDGEMSHIVTVADESILDAERHVTV